MVHTCASEYLEGRYGTERTDRGIPCKEIAVDTPQAATANAPAERICLKSKQRADRQVHLTDSEAGSVAAELASGPANAGVGCANRLGVSRL
jgi:hypothetical protein